MKRKILQTTLSVFMLLAFQQASVKAQSLTITEIDTYSELNIIVSDADLYATGQGPVALSDGGTGTSMSPLFGNSDQLMYWDKSEEQMEFVYFDPTDFEIFGPSFRLKNNFLQVTEIDSYAELNSIITDTTLYGSNQLDVRLEDGGTGASLVDPNQDSILFWG